MDSENKNQANAKAASSPVDVESICQRFRSQQIELESFIQSESLALSNERLCLRLIQSDLERKRQSGLSADASEYSKLFPNLDAQSIRDLLLMPEPPPVDLEGPLLPKRYRALKEIGAGGIGNVWRVFDKTLERPLAVKVLHQKFRTSPAANARLDREALVTGLLQHPGVPPIHDRGKLVTGSSFFAMKLVEGETLAEILDRSDFQQKRMHLIGIFEQIAQTIAYAHTQKIVHRDLKPANVMVGEFGEVQVMDWGMAKVLDASSRKPSANAAAEPRPELDDFHLGDANLAETILRANDSSISEPHRELTRHGDVIGTPSYMAPEQATGKLDEISPASDVFSLGAILLELLTGKPLYSEVPDESLIAAAASGSVDESLKRLRSMNLDAELFDLARDCLSRDPASRPADGSAVAQRVTRYLHSVEARLRESELSIGKAEVKIAEERKRKRLAFVLVATIFLAILIGVVGFMWFQQQSDRQEIANLKSQTETLVLAVGSSPVEELELSIANLTPFEAMAKNALISELEKVEDSGLKTRYAIALAHFDDLRIPLLVDKLPDVEQALVLPLIKALAKDPENSAVELIKRFDTTDGRSRQARLVVASIAMDNPTLLDRFISDAAVGETIEDQRFALVDAYRVWNGSIIPLWETYLDREDSKTRYFLLASIAEVPVSSIEKDELETVAASLLKSYPNESRASIRAMIELILKRWQKDLPAIAPTSEPKPGFDWYANSLGNILIRHEVHFENNGIRYGYFVSDREVTANLFQQFINEDTEAASREIVLGKTGLDRMWKGKTFKDVIDGAISSSCDNGRQAAVVSPMTRFGFYTALRFCNWLSRKEGLEPYYVNLDPELEKSTFAFDPRVENWVKNQAANGYRLPSLSEYLQAAASDSIFNLERVDADYHTFIGWSSKNATKPQPVATRLPNSLGLFDAYGNLTEMGDLRDPNLALVYFELGGSFTSANLNHNYKPGAWPSPTITSDKDTGIRLVRMTKKQIQTRSQCDREFELRIQYAKSRFIEKPETLEELAKGFSRDGLAYLRNGPLPFADLCLSFSREIATRLIDQGYNPADMLVLRGGDSVNAAIANRSMKLFDRCYKLLDSAEEDLKAALSYDKDAKQAQTFLKNKEIVLVQTLTMHASRLSTDMNPNYRDGEKAVRIAKQAVAMNRSISTLAILAASYAEDKQFDKAIQIQEEILSLLTDTQTREKTVHRVRLKKFQEKKPLRFRQ